MSPIRGVGKYIPLHFPLPLRERSHTYFQSFRSNGTPERFYASLSVPMCPRLTSLLLRERIKGKRVYHKCIDPAPKNWYIHLNQSISDVLQNIDTDVTRKRGVSVIFRFSLRILNLVP